MPHPTTLTLAGVTVRRIGFGAMQLPGPGVFGPPRDRATALAVLRAAADAGVNHIDTAEFYGPSVSNELIREALHPYPDDLAIVTKVGARRDGEGAWIPAQRPEELRADVEENLATLGVDHLAVVNLRRFDIDGGHGGPGVALEDQLGALVALRDEGKIDGVGLSNVTAATVEAALRTTDIACVQNPFSLVAQEDRPVLELTASRGIAYVPYFPLGSGFPGATRVTDQPSVIAVAQRLGHTPAQIGLAWLLAQGPTVAVIPGTSQVAHLQENLGAGEVELDADDLAELTRGA